MDLSLFNEVLCKRKLPHIFLYRYFIKKKKKEKKVLNKEITSIFFFYCFQNLIWFEEPYIIWIEDKKAKNFYTFSVYRIST
jgi:hypothetical protein